jgi:hypothetical protein
VFLDEFNKDIKQMIKLDVAINEQDLKDRWYDGMGLLDIHLGLPRHLSGSLDDTFWEIARITDSYAETVRDELTFQRKINLGGEFSDD